MAPCSDPKSRSRRTPRPSTDFSASPGGIPRGDISLLRHRHGEVDACDEARTARPWSQPKARAFVPGQYGVRSRERDDQMVTAAVCRGLNEDLVIEQLDLEAPKDGEVLVRM